MQNGRQSTQVKLIYQFQNQGFWGKATVEFREPRCRSKFAEFEEFEVRKQGVSPFFFVWKGKFWQFERNYQVQILIELGDARNFKQIWIWNKSVANW